MIKLIATDLDGTLFYPKKRFRMISTKNRKFISDFVNNGGKVVLVSGRNYPVCSKIAKKVKVPVDMIACNGSCIYKDGKIVYDSPMDHEMVRDLIFSNLEGKVLSWVVMSDKYPNIILLKKDRALTNSLVDIAMYFQFAYGEPHKVGLKHLEKVLNDKEARIYKVMALFGLRDTSIEVAREQLPLFIDAYGTKMEVLWSRQSIEFMNKDINKANTLKKYLKMVELEDGEVAVVGDSGNDIPLFEAFENSFVISNATVEVKEKAKTQIDGVYCLKDYI